MSWTRWLTGDTRECVAGRYIGERVPSRRGAYVHPEPKEKPVTSVKHPCVNLDGVPATYDQIPEAVALLQGALIDEPAHESVILLKTLRAALWAVQSAELDEDRIMEFCSYALAADPANPNL